MRFACCFCGGNIPRSDRGAVQFAVTSLWDPTDEVQGLQAHAACAEKAITVAPLLTTGIDDD